MRAAAIYAVLALLVVPGPLLLLSGWLLHRRALRRAEATEDVGLDLLPDLFELPLVGGAHEAIPDMSPPARRLEIDHCKRMWALPDAERNRS